VTAACAMLMIAALIFGASLGTFIAAFVIGSRG
jgi:hypothetical protein